MSIRQKYQTFNGHTVELWYSQYWNGCYRWTGERTWNKAHDDFYHAYTEEIEPDNRLKPTPLCTRDVVHTKTGEYIITNDATVGEKPVYGAPVPSWLLYRGYCPYIGRVGQAAVWAQNSDLNKQGKYALPDVQGKHNDAIYRAFRASVPNVDTKFSLPNFLWELKDLSTLFHVFDAKWSIKEHAENGFLNWNFGWVPFMSDMREILKAIKKVKSHWDHVCSNQGNVVTMKGRAGYTSEVKHSDIYWPYWNGDDTNSMVRCYYAPTTRVDGKVMFQTQYKYDVLDTSTGARSDVPPALFAKSVLQALNVVADPKIVWDALPFSFVLDWFLPVGDALRTMRKDTFVPGYTIISSDMHSTVTERYITDVHMLLYSSPAVWNTDPVNIEQRVRTYERKANVDWESIQSPSFMDKLEINLPTGKQWFLGVVLGSSIFL
jgi:hypothetical protein